MTDELTQTKDRERAATDIEIAICDLDSVIDNVNWHETMPDPDLTVIMIEAKAKLLEARKKLTKVLQAVKK